MNTTNPKGFYVDGKILSPKEFRDELRTALADYMNSEGCGCCVHYDSYTKNKERLGKLLDVPKYEDGNGRNFSIYESFHG